MTKPPIPPPTKPPTPTPPLRLSLELERSAGPIAGRLLDEQGAGLSFIGWLELTRTLEQARGEKGPGTDHTGEDRPDQEGSP